jgi:hypothetical protein
VSFSWENARQKARSAGLFLIEVSVFPVSHTNVLGQSCLTNHNPYFWSILSYIWQLLATLFFYFVIRRQPTILNEVLEKLANKTKVVQQYSLGAIYIA